MQKYPYLCLLKERSIMKAEDAEIVEKKIMLNDHPFKKELKKLRSV